MFNKLIKYLSSLRFTILLICLLGLIFAIGLWVPQQRLLKTIYLEWQKNSPALVAFLDALGLTTIYTSPITITLWLLFFLNLSLVLWQRLPIIKSRISDLRCENRRSRDCGGLPVPEAHIHCRPIWTEIRLSACSARAASPYWAMQPDFYGVKNRLAPIAFMLFHLSFFLILLGGLISVYTEFIGYLDLAQGESFQGELNRYNTVAATENAGDRLSSQRLVYGKEHCSAGCPQYADRNQRPAG